MEEKEKNLSYFKWEVADVDIMRSLYSKEQIGEIFLAVMETVKTGERVELSDKFLSFPYLTFCKKVENARNKYIDTCEKRAIAGAKGGKAKAEKSRNATDEGIKFKPPTKTDFKNATKYIYNRYFDGEKFDVYSIEKLYNSYQQKGWKCDNEKTIGSNYHIECIIVAYAIKEIYGSYVGFKLLDILERKYPDELEGDQNSGNLIYECWNDYYDEDLRKFTQNIDKTTCNEFESAELFLKWFIGS